MSTAVTPKDETQPHFIWQVRCVNPLAGYGVLMALISAGYNQQEVAEYLLMNGAEVNAQDKGGLIPLHNASSYGVSDTDTWKTFIGA